MVESNIKQRRRQIILDASQELFNEKGFIEVTVSDIAKRAKMGRRTLYDYFRTKDEILLVIREKMLDELHLFEYSVDCDDDYEKLISLVDQLWNHWKQLLDRWRFIIQFNLFFDDDKLEELVLPKKYPILVDMLKQHNICVDKGILTGDSESTFIAFNLIYGYVMRFALRSKYKKIDNVLDNEIEYYSIENTKSPAEMIFGSMRTRD